MEKITFTPASRFYLATPFVEKKKIYSPEVFENVKSIEWKLCAEEDILMKYSKYEARGIHM